MKHKLLTLLLAMMASIGIMQAEIYSGTCGENLTWSLNTEDSVLTISGTGAMADFPNNTHAPWNGYSSLIQSIVIEDGVTSIGNYAFAFCSNLTSIRLGRGLISIGEHAFFSCTLLEAVTLPAKVTSIGDYAFASCNRLISVINYATQPQAINTNTFLSYAESTTLYVPAESLAAYQTADVWKEFTNIQAIGSSEEINYVTLADIYNMAEDSVFTLGAFDVVYVPDLQNGANMYVKDASGSGVIYKPSYGLQAGDHVEAGLQGKVSIYHGLYEIAPVSTKEELTITSGEAPAPMEATEVPSLTNVNQYVVYKDVSFSTDTAFVEGRRHMVYGTWNDQEIAFYNQYYIGATLQAGKTYHITAVNTVYGTTPQAYPLAVEEASSDTPEPCVIASGTCGAQGDNLTWTLTCNSVLTISGTGAMADYSIYNPAPWYSHVLSVKAVVVNEGVTGIGQCAFMDCSGLTSVTISNSVTSVGGAAFIRCASLTSVTIPNSVTSIGVNAFQSCSSLTSVEIPNSVTSIGDFAFNLCSGLTSVTISNSVTYIAEGVFSDCENLTSINVDTDNPKYCSVDGVLFTKNITNLKQYPAGKQGAYTIPSNVTYISPNAFRWCIGLTSVEIPNSVTRIGDNAFSGCSGLTSVTIPNSVTNIGLQAFYYCNSLTSIEISESTTSIDKYAFQECSGLISVTNYATEPQAIDSTTFANVNLAACTLYIPAESVEAYQAAEVWKEFGNILAIGSEPTPCITASGTCGAEGDNLTWTLTCDSVLTISGTGAMADFSNSGDVPWNSFTYTHITSVVIEEGVTYIGANTFTYHSSIKSISIPSTVIAIHVRAVIACSSSFYVNANNPNYSSIDGTLFDNEQITLIQYPVGKMDSHYVIPNTVNTIGSCAFYGANFESVIIPNSVTAIANSAFRYCRALTSVSIPNSVQTIDYDAFEYCDNLVSVDIPSSVTYIGNAAFAGNRNLQTINVDEANPNYSSIDGVLFNKNQTKLIQYPIGKEDTLYTIPNTVTTIGRMSFSYILKHDNIKLTSLIIPNSVTTIEASAFWDADDLTSITNYATTPQVINSNVFYAVDLSTYTLYVPAASLAAYQTAEVWKDFGTILTINGSGQIETEETAANVIYTDKADNEIYSETVLLHLPVAPQIDGFSFLKWQVIAGDLENGIFIQAVYTANIPTNTPSVYTNPTNKAQKLIRNGNVYILYGEKIYTVTGAEVK